MANEKSAKQTKERDQRAINRTENKCKLVPRSHNALHDDAAKAADMLYQVVSKAAPHVKYDDLVLRDALVGAMEARKLLLGKDDLVHFSFEVCFMHRYHGWRYPRKKDELK